MGPSLLKTYSSADCDNVSHEKCALGCTTIASSNILYLKPKSKPQIQNLT